MMWSLKVRDVMLCNVWADKMKMLIFMMMVALGRRPNWYDPNIYGWK